MDGARQIRRWISPIFPPPSHETFTPEYWTQMMMGVGRPSGSATKPTECSVHGLSETRTDACLWNRRARTPTVHNRRSPAFISQARTIHRVNTWPQPQAITLRRGKPAAPAARYQCGASRECIVHSEGKVSCEARRNGNALNMETAIAAKSPAAVMLKRVTTRLRVGKVRAQASL
jgi:hypothetical protein